MVVSSFSSNVLMLLAPVDESQRGKLLISRDLLTSGRSKFGHPMSQPVTSGDIACLRTSRWTQHLPPKSSTLAWWIHRLSTVFPTSSLPSANGLSTVFPTSTLPPAMAVDQSSRPYRCLQQRLPRRHQSRWAAANGIFKPADGKTAYARQLERPYESPVPPFAEWVMWN